MISPSIPELSRRPASWSYSRHPLQFRFNGRLESTRSKCSLLLDVSAHFTHSILHDGFKKQGTIGRTAFLNGLTRLSILVVGMNKPVGQAVSVGALA
jgi:hypothetical protein